MFSFFSLQALSLKLNTACHFFVPKPGNLIATVYMHLASSEILFLKFVTTDYPPTLKVFCLVFIFCKNHKS